MAEAIRLQSVYKVFSAYPEPILALNGISFSLEEGSLTVIGGANGSGKSVLMHIVSGLMEPTKGSVFTSSKPGLVFQDAATQILGDTVFLDVAVGPRNMGIKKKDIPAVVTEALKAVSLEEKSEISADFLSGGQKRRLAVASILAMNRNIIIFDEPYANLDFFGVKDINALIKNLHTQKKTVLLLTHELEKCLGLATTFLVLHKGSLVFNGSPQEALTQNLEAWGIKNPLSSHYQTVEDLVW